MDYHKKYFITGIVTSLSTALTVPLFSFIYGATKTDIIKNSVFGLLFSVGLFCFVLFFYGGNRLDYDNGEHSYRFLLVYSLILAFSVLFPLIDPKAWVFMGACIVLSLFSQSVLSLYAAAGLIMISVLLSETRDATAFLVYFLPCAIGIMLFQDIEDDFEVGKNIFISSLTLFVFETAGFVIFENKNLSAEQFIMPIVNVIVNVLLLFLCLKYFNEKVANKYRNKYLELNDQSYSVLLELKEKSVSEYFRSIHTAYLTERIANAVGCDVDAAKNCAYYHRIKKAFSYSLEDVKKFVKEHEFPPKAQETLLEYLSKSQKFDSREVCIVYITDKFISSLLTIFSKDSKAKVDYKDLIDTILNKDYVKKNISESRLTLNDLKLIREIVLRETLYYDFLR
ncbi:MAG: hypothetical protein K6E32_09390 [Lachnospiraceae bacterium]|nr:hypothetical protein [Lachnospiraceae bacterium]